MDLHWQLMPRRPTVDEFWDHVQQAQHLIEYMGLNNTFSYACPSENELSSGSVAFLGGQALSEVSQGFFFDYPIDDWLETMRSSMTLPATVHDDALLQVAVHVRRGDVKPCMRRYLSNSYYLKVLEQHLPQYCGDDVLQHCNVTIYTQSETVESLEPFVERGYSLDLDSPLQDVWREFIQADIFLQSESAFSFVPGLLNNNVNIYSGYDIGFPYPSNWVIVDEAIRTAARLDNQKLLCNDS